jgi:predicted Fe-S protein YdhL (DUF1289 family)
MDARSGFCEGCLRTIDEIAAWSKMTADEKLAVWDALAQRRLDAGRPIEQAPLLPRA